jgi:hypothetical protein
MVLHGVLSPSECRSIIAYMDGLGENHDRGLQPAMSRIEYRNNMRLVGRSDAIATLLSGRIRPFLSELYPRPDRAAYEAAHATEEPLASDGRVIIDDANRSLFTNRGFGMEGTWRYHQLNPVFRLCKYHPGGHFGPHFDAEFAPEMEYRSMKTFMIYLNDDYESGTTNFVDEGAELYKDPTLGIYVANPKDVRLKFKAKAGDAIIFDHQLLHEGARVDAGKKYIMRSDVMYRRDAQSEDDLTPELLRRKRAMQLWTEGSQMEARGEMTGAVEMYRKANKLAPELFAKGGAGY